MLPLLINLLLIKYCLIVYQSIVISVNFNFSFINVVETNSAHLSINSANIDPRLILRVLSISGAFSAASRCN